MVSPALQHWRSKSPVSSLRQNNNRMLCFLQSPPWSFGAWCSVTPWNHYCGLQSRWCLTQWKRHRIWRSSLHISSFLFTSLHIRFLFSSYMFLHDYLESVTLKAPLEDLVQRTKYLQGSPPTPSESKVTLLQSRKVNEAVAERNINHLCGLDALPSHEVNLRAKPSHWSFVTCLWNRELSGCT